MEQVVWGTNIWLREGLPRASHSPDRMGLPKDKGIFDPIKLIRIISIIIPEKAMASHSVLLPGKSHGWRSLEGCSPWGCRESDTTEQLHFHFSLSCIGEGNGNPLLCSCLENPRDGGAWWAAIYGVAQSRTQLKWLSSSSSSIIIQTYFFDIFYNFPSVCYFDFLS